jgi:hypothetical protein
VTDDEGAIEALLDLDAGAGVADPIWAWRDLEGVAVEGDGVVVGNGTAMLEAEDLLGD